MIWELCRQEARKLFSYRYPWILAGVVLLVEAAFMVSKALTPAETTLEIVTAPQLFAEGVGWGLRFGVYTVLVIGAMGFSQEFAQGTVKTVLMLPVRRYEWVLAKLIALAALSWGLLLACVGLGVAIAAVSPGWGPIVRSGVELYSASDVWVAVASATGLTGLFLLPLCTFALLASIHFGSSGAAVGVTLVLGILVETAAEMLDVGRWVFFHHLHVPLQIVAKMGKGLPFQWNEALTWGIGVSFVSFSVFAGWLVWRMERRDITE